MYKILHIMTLKALRDQWGSTIFQSQEVAEQFVQQLATPTQYVVVPFIRGVRNESHTIGG